MTSFLGWIGSICFALSAAPQAYQSYRLKNSDGISWGFLLLWLMGEVAMIAYSVLIWNTILLTNYLVNLAFCLLIAYYKVYGETYGKIRPKPSSIKYSEII